MPNHSLNENGQFLASILNSSDDSITSTSLDGVITRWNRGAENIYGYSEEEAIGKSISIIIPADRLGEEREIIGKIQNGEYIKNYETERIRKDKSRIIISLTVSPIFNDTRTIIGVAKIARDITEQKKTAEALKKSENFLRAIVQTEPECIKLLNKKGEVELMNPAGLSMIEAEDMEEIRGKDVSLIIDEADRKAFKQLTASIFQGKSGQLSFQITGLKGSKRWLETHAVPLRDIDGKIVLLLGVTRDITAQKNAEIQKTLLAEISMLFNKYATVNETLHEVVRHLVEIGNFSIAETWLIDSEKKRINLVAKFSSDISTQLFYDKSAEIKSFERGHGMPGIAWKNKSLQHWENIHEHNDFVRKNAAKSAGLRTAYAQPIFYNHEVIGVFVLILNETTTAGNYSTLFENLASHTGVEIKRKQLEQELDQIFRFAPDIICIAGLDGYFKKINPAACELLEYTEEELLTMPAAALLHPEGKKKSMDIAKDLEHGNPVHYYENRYITKSGNVKWLAWTSVPYEGGLIFAVAKDITEKKEIETMFNKATKLARIGGWEYNLLNGRLFWSDITKEIHEVEPDFEPNVDTAIHFYKEGEPREKISSLVQEAIEKGIPWDFEAQIITANGNERWVRGIGEAEIINGKCTRLYGSFQDVDIRKRAELAVLNALEEKNTILESIGDAFFAVDKTWKVTYWNRQAEILLDKPKKFVLNNYLWEVFTESVNSESYKKYHEAVEKRQVIHFEDYYEPLSRWYEISAYPSRNGLSVYFKDITELKLSSIHLQELNDTLKKKAKELVLSNTELEQFAYVASHDLQEPLRMVTSFLTQLERKYEDILDEKGKKYIYFAVDGAKRMRQIILDLLEYSRIGRVEEPAEDLDLNELIQEIQILFRKQIEEKRAVIRVAELPKIKAHRTPMRQIFQNLVMNALKYIREDTIPNIAISVTDDDTYWQFAVSDNGIGINTEYFDKIFIIFQRLHNKEDYSGTGMGLAITKKIIENLGGKIWVESEEGKGSTFYFTVLKT